MNQITLKQSLINQIADNYLCSLHHEVAGRKDVAANLRMQAIGVADLGRDQFGFDTKELHSKAMDIYDDKKALYGLAAV